MFNREIVKDGLPDPHKGFFLWVWYADKIPPHIGCSLNGAYYSLKVSGKDKALPASKVFKLIHEKRIAFLLVELNDTVTIERLEAVYALHESASQDVSCLTPVLDLFDNPEGVEILADLIARLERCDGIKCIFGLNLPANYAGIPSYTMTEVKSRLLKLESAKKQINIS
jgi:hypothetical protein